jgi:UDP-N-acetylmuramoyl-L-alanyl-D-glutamate--2,6-diaminopimelate ligase
VTASQGEEALAAALAAAEPSGPRPLGELIGRLEAEGLLRAVHLPPGAAAASDAAAPSAAPVEGLTYDSRLIRGGWLFVAVAGEHADGHDHAPQAAARGAAALIVERIVEGVTVPQLVVDRSRAALASAAAWWYGDPSLQMGIVGITGTDGKTTTSFLATAALEAAGISTGLLTTAEIKIGALRGANPEHVTTPEAPRLQQSLRAMVAAGNTAAIVETTSHGLALERVGSIAYDVGIFTNLSHEHLELHKTFEAYREAKVSLFARLGRHSKSLLRPFPATAIVNLDDPAAALFVEAGASAGAGIVTYGRAAEATVRAVAAEETAQRLTIEALTPRWRGKISLRLAGRFNVHNALAALALAETLELDPGAVRAGLEGVAGVPGRMERVDCGQPFGVVVDYAHSPASLRGVLDELGPVACAAGGGLIAVFGSAGERDVAKRPMMGRVAGERCRLVIVADEDPRSEDRHRILDEIAAGAEAAGRRRGEDLLCIADRREAIATAFRRARAGDVVVLAGKGHEQSIIMSDGPVPWDERTEAVGALRSMGFEGDQQDA